MVSCLTIYNVLKKAKLKIFIPLTRKTGVKSSIIASNFLLKLKNLLDKKTETNSTLFSFSFVLFMAYLQTCSFFMIIFFVKMFRNIYRLIIN